MKRIKISSLLAFFLAAGIYGASAAQFSSSLETLSALAPSAFDPARFPLAYVTVADYPADLSGEQLFQYLHTVTVPKAPPPEGHDYLDAKKFMFASADNTGCGGVPGVVAFYSQICVKGASGHGEDYKEKGDQNGDGVVDSGGMNAEHMWPQAYFNKAYPMKSDLHHIQPTFLTPNGRRGSMPFTTVVKAQYSTSSGSKLGPDGFEPCDPVKGDAARALLYFVVRYYDRNIRDGMNYKNFWTDKLPMLLEWNRRDPPDANEKRRNDLIAQFQGNRNPFVDDPALADRIGTRVFAAH
ncbi:MAG TPA: hypothetical protein DCL44_05220 [Elusimicrobia bacterium]|nr:hypothetical protein [Elusimicrobiota bacterium]